MAWQLSNEARAAALDAIDTTAGANPVIKIRSGAPPANCAAADSGTVLATITITGQCWGNADGATGTMAKAAGTWQDTSADNTGTAGHFRVYKSDGTTCVGQGTCGQGTGDMSLDNTSFVAGQSFTINSLTVTIPNG